jgi:hypothetical protein
LGRQPGIAAEKNQLSARIGLSQVRFENRPVLSREMAQDITYPSVQTPICHLEFTFDSGRQAIDRKHQLAADTNAVTKVSLR